MKFLLDHDVAAAVRDALDRHGHEAMQLTDLLPRNAPDDVVFATAQSNQCVMITCNRNDFLKLAAKGPVNAVISSFISADPNSPRFF